MTTHSYSAARPATVDRAPLVMAAAAVLATLALIWLISAPVPMTALYFTAAVQLLIQQRLLLTDQPSPFLGGTFGLALLSLTASVLLLTAPPLLFITGWLVWGGYGVLLTSFAICLLAAGSKMLLPVETPGRSPALFWAGMVGVLSCYVAVALYLTYVLI